MYLGCKVCTEAMDRKMRYIEARMSDMKAEMIKDIESAVKWAELNGERASCMRLKSLLRQWRGEEDGDKVQSVRKLD